MISFQVFVVCLFLTSYLTCSQARHNPQQQRQILLCAQNASSTTKVESLVAPREVLGTKSADVLAFTPGKKDFRPAKTPVLTRTRKLMRMSNFLKTLFISKAWTLLTHHNRTTTTSRTSPCSMLFYLPFCMVWRYSLFSYFDYGYNRVYWCCYFD